MKINGNAIRPGNVIEHKGGLWRAVKIQHTQPGKGGAYLQVELRNLRDGSKLNERFRASQNVERVRLDQREHQYLYGDGERFTFMDTESFEQVQLTGETLGESVNYLLPEAVIVVELFDGEPVGIQLPLAVELQVTETAPAIKGATASAQLKPAQLETGLVVQVPPFIANGDRVRVNTETGEYQSRV